MVFEELLPPLTLSDQKLWGARTAIGTYVILEDEQFTASFKDLDGKTHYLIQYEKPVKTFARAKRICEQHHNRQQQ